MGDGTDGGSQDVDTRPRLLRILSGGGRVAWQVVGVAIVLWIAGRTYASLSLVLLAVFVALVVAAAVIPGAKRLERIGIGRTAAAVVTVGGLLLTLAGTGAVLVVRVTAELPTLTDDLRAQRGPALRWLEESPLHLSEEEVAALLDRSVESMGEGDGDESAVAAAADAVDGDDTEDADAAADDGPSAGDEPGAEPDDGEGPSVGVAVAVLRQVAAAAQTLGFVLLGFVLAFFLVRDRDAIAAATVEHLVGGQHDRIAHVVLGRAWRALLGYVRASLLVGLVDATLIGVVLFAVGVPLAGPLTVLTFLAAFVPVVGAVTVGLLSALIALVSEGAGAATVVAIAIVVVQQLDGNVLQPVLVRQGTGLHPVATILALTVGGILGGVLGALLAVPVTAVLVAAAGALLDAGVGLDEPVEPPPEPATP